MSEENDWDHNVEGDAIEGSSVCVSKDDMVQLMKTGKTAGAQMYLWMYP